MANADGNDERWWRAEKSNVHEKVISYVRQAEQELGSILDRIFRLECLYDPNSPDAESSQQKDRVTENAIASNVDTISAVIASTDIRARFMTDGADWKTQRRARHLEWYAEDLQTRYGVLGKCRRAFKEAVKKGNGIVKTHAVLGEPSVEHVLVENVIVPPEECRDGRTPTQIHQYDYIDADRLTAMFPDSEAEIEQARRTGARRRLQYGRMIANDVECLWSIRLPIGKKPKKWSTRMKAPGYVPGRITLCIAGKALYDKPYHKPHFPFAMMVWTERVTSFYGIGGAERIMGIQRALNKRNWQIESALEKTAQPTTYVRPADANLAAKSNRVGAVAVVRGDYPVTVTPPVVNAETYQSRRDLRDSAGEEFGQTRMVTHGSKPTGLDSAVALREFTDQTSQRFASQEKAFEEDLVLQTNFLMLDTCKDLGDEAPVVMRRTRFGAKKIKWSDVDMGEVKVQMKAAANMNRTPAGRTQLVIEFAQAGIISTDQARKLAQHPDIERELSLYTSALEAIEHSLDEIADGAAIVPEPYDHHEMCVWRAQREYLQWRDDGAPEEILENLRQYIVTAAWMIERRNAGAANQNAGDPAAMAASGGPDSAMPPPMTDMAAAAPQAALAQQAMQLQAS